MRGITLLADRKQRPLVEALLRQMDIETMVPLSAADQLTSKMVGQVSPFHPLYLFNKVETFNRAVAGLAKYQEATLRNVGHVEAIQQAKQFIAETQFVYNISDTPRLMQGPLGATAFQFKKFVVKELEFLWGLRHDPRALARFVINVQAIGGASALFNLPPFSLLDWASGKLTDQKLSEALQAAFPEGARGLPGVLGTDIGANVAPGVPGEISAREIFGPGVNDLMIGAQQVSKEILNLIDRQRGVLTPQDRARAISQVAPVMVRRLMDAYDVAVSGAVRTRGTTDVNFFPENPSKTALMTGLGLRTIEHAEFSRGVTMTLREREHAMKADQAVVQRVVRAFLQNDNAKAEAILRDAEARDIVVTKRQLQDALIDAHAGRTIGLIRGAPRETRDKVFERFERFLTKF